MVAKEGNMHQSIAPRDVDSSHRSGKKKKHKKRRLDAISLLSNRQLISPPSPPEIARGLFHGVDIGKKGKLVHKVNKMPAAPSNGLSSSIPSARHTKVLHPSASDPSSLSPQPCRVVEKRVKLKHKRAHKDVETTSTPVESTTVAPRIDFRVHSTTSPTTPHTCPIKPTPEVAREADSESESSESDFFSVGMELKNEHTVAEDTTSLFCGYRGEPLKCLDPPRKKRIPGSWTCSSSVVVEHGKSETASVSVSPDGDQLVPHQPKPTKSKSKNAPVECIGCGIVDRRQKATCRECSLSYHRLCLDVPQRRGMKKSTWQCNDCMEGQVMANKQSRLEWSSAFPNGGPSTEQLQRFWKSMHARAIEEFRTRPSKVEIDQGSVKNEGESSSRGLQELKAENVRLMGVLQGTLAGEALLLLQKSNKALVKLVLKRSTRAEPQSKTSTNNTEPPGQDVALQAQLQSNHVVQRNGNSASANIPVPSTLSTGTLPRPKPTASPPVPSAVKPGDKISSGTLTLKPEMGRAPPSQTNLVEANVACSSQKFVEMGGEGEESDGYSSDATTVQQEPGNANSTCNSKEGVQDKSNSSSEGTTSSGDEDSSSSEEGEGVADDSGSNESNSSEEDSDSDT
ncbi:unnamed protein product [Choristocarpus tenellus]